MTGRRQLGYAVALCLAGAGLALFGATREWTSADQPETGGDIMPWLPALAWAGLAGAGAVLATRRRARTALGVLLLCLGAGVAVGGGFGLADSAGWPLACVAGGLLLAAGGALTAARGAGWPSLGARYERNAGSGDGPTAAWDALDRGEDPTLS